MNLEPVIEKRLSQFVIEFGLGDKDASTQFEYFVNYHIGYSHHPEVFFGNNGILEAISIGGRDDCAIDGIAIMVNDRIVVDKETFDAIIESKQKLEIDFIFIQAKKTAKTNMGKVNNFLDGIRDFFSENGHLPKNENIKRIQELTSVVMDEQYLRKWKRSPKLYAYFVNLGQGGSQHTEGLIKHFIDDISKMNTFDDDISVEIFGERRLERLCNQNLNYFSVSFNIIDEMALPESGGVDNASVVLCYASEFLKLIVNEDDKLRKVVFTDNVRDYQGDTPINVDIENTICNHPHSFSMLNNGVTIVCDDFTQKNRTINLNNPQIVNGCQTSNVIYQCRNSKNIFETPLVVKIIATQNSDITNSIVRSTNRQNIVYDEAFEITREFHKDLEKFFSSLDFSGNKIFYERRMRQFQDDLEVKQNQKVSFKNLIQTSTAVLLRRPDFAHRHESILLKEFKELVFSDAHSKYPYYVACAMNFLLGEYYQDHYQKTLTYRPYRFHILFIIRMLLIREEQPDLESRSEIDKYFKKVIESFIQKKDELIGKSMQIFDTAIAKWEELGKSKHGFKDQLAFVELVGKMISGDNQFNGTPVKYKGQVTCIKLDRNKRFYRFITTSQDDYFFHEGKNRTLDWKNLLRCNVSFDIEKSKYKGFEAINVALTV